MKQTQIIEDKALKDLRIVAGSAFAGSLRRCSKPPDGFFRLSYGRSPVVTFFQKLFSRKSEPVKRVHVCVECGMPVAEHKEWCSIYRTQEEMAKKGPSAARA